MPLSTFMEVPLDTPPTSNDSSSQAQSPQAGPAAAVAAAATPGAPNSRPPRVVVKDACDRCKGSHVKCERAATDDPCIRCTKHGKHCTRTTSDGRTRDAAETTYQDLVNRIQRQAAAFCLVVGRMADRDSDVSKEFDRGYPLDRVLQGRVPDEAWRDVRVRLPLPQRSKGNSLKEKRGDRNQALTAGAVALAYMEGVCEMIMCDPSPARQMYNAWATPAVGVNVSGYDHTAGIEHARVEAWKKELDAKVSGTYRPRMCGE
ncbi:hypothetical protein HD806DRAFT_398130 [Xylariaceae sp. AK1471]|nr:hypothetical protein HD806DRAFT_398130 [Xylariaceae sp. AK1471]